MTVTHHTAQALLQAFQLGFWNVPVCDTLCAGACLFYGSSEPPFATGTLSAAVPVPETVSILIPSARIFL